MEATAQTTLKASELRIGNFFRYVKTKQLVKLNHGLFWQLLESNAFDEFEAIPLTPEILEKCGFEKNRNDFTLNISEYAALYMDKDMEEYNIFNVALREIHPDDEGNSILLTTNMRYLHQLQNLYFALTGEELQINI